MQENYRTFPSFVNAEYMTAVTSDTDYKLYNIRELIAEKLAEVAVNHRMQNPRSIEVDLRGLNYLQIKTLHDELIERKFRLEYTIQVRIGSNGYSSKNCVFADIDGYGDMPYHMIIYWK